MSNDGKANDSAPAGKTVRVVHRTVTHDIVDGKHVRTETIVTTVDDPRNFDELIPERELSAFEKMFGRFW